MRGSDKDFLLSLFFVAGSGLLILYLIPQQVGAFGKAAGYVPFGATSVIAAMSIYMAVRTWPRGRRLCLPAFAHTVQAKTAICAAIMVLLSFLLPLFGMVLTTAAGLAILLTVCGNRNTVNITVVTTVVVVTLYTAFQYLLGIPLPVGRIFE